jgi:hypothetical protein
MSWWLPLLIADLALGTGLLIWAAVKSIQLELEARRLKSSSQSENNARDRAAA